MVLRLPGTGAAGGPLPLAAPTRVRHRGTDNPRHKGGDYFGAVAQKLGDVEADPVPAGATTVASLGETG